MGHFHPPDTTLVHPTAVKPLRAKGGLASCQSICKPRFMVAQTLMYFAEARESVRGARPQADATATTVPHGAKTAPRAKPSRIRARMRCRKKGRFGKESGGEERKDFSLECVTPSHIVEDCSFPGKLTRYRGATCGSSLRPAALLASPLGSPLRLRKALPPYRIEKGGGQEGRVVVGKTLYACTLLSLARRWTTPSMPSPTRGSKLMSRQ